MCIIDFLLVWNSGADESFAFVSRFADYNACLPDLMELFIIFILCLCVAVRDLWAFRRFGLLVAAFARLTSAIATSAMVTWTAWILRLYYRFIYRKELLFRLVIDNSVHALLGWIDIIKRQLADASWGGWYCNCLQRAHCPIVPLVFCIDCCNTFGSLRYRYIW